MHTTITRPRPVPLLLGAFFTAVTARVLFDDVIASPLPLIQAINTGHALSLAALVAAIASGHYVWPTARRGHLPAAAALAVLFAAATVYVVVASGARSAHLAAAKAAASAESARAHDEAALALREATERRATADAYAERARDDAAAECRSGKGKRCDGANTTRDAAAEVARLRTIEVDKARAALAAIPATPAANAGYAHMARVLAAIGAGGADDIQARLELLVPVAVVLITELATIVFLGLGLPAASHRQATTLSRLPATVSAPRKPLPPALTALVARPAASVAIVAATPETLADDELESLRKAFRHGETHLDNATLAHRMGVSEGEASKRVTAAQRAGHATRTRAGRHVEISLA